MSVSLPYWLQKYVTTEGKRGTHRCDYLGQTWRFRVPARDQAAFKRDVDAAAHFSPGATITPINNAECVTAVQEWAQRRLVHTDSDKDRVAAVKLLEEFNKDAGTRRTSRAIGNALTWLGHERVKSHGVNVYKRVRLI
jgi:hypothetical protein